MKHITLAAEMVRAILEGNKTQTRRPVTSKNSTASWPVGEFLQADISEGRDPHDGKHKPFVPILPSRNSITNLEPIWEPGDRLQVKDGPVLEVVSVRAERVQDIKEPDCWAEGFADCAEINCSCCFNRFRRCWDSIYHKKPDLNWNANPFVWVISFKVVP